MSQKSQRSQRSQRKCFVFFLCDLCVLCGLCVTPCFAGTKITFDDSGVMAIDGKRTFVISVTMPPPPDGKTPEGKDAYAELRDAGVNFMRIPPPEQWNDSGLAA